MHIRQATTSDLTGLTQLFAKYRIFYGQENDTVIANKFLKLRLTQNDSVIFVALEGEELVAFAQIYPSFTSIGVKEIWILNDIFVDTRHRSKGFGRALIEHVLEFSRKTGRKKVVLLTADSNLAAQRLYESTGFSRTVFCNYEKLTDETTP